MNDSTATTTLAQMGNLISQAHLRTMGFNNISDRAAMLTFLAQMERHRQTLLKIGKPEPAYRDWIND